ncbi:MAG TPA: ZIP family metal transporter [Candidatus Paceibacterota bacterium]|nr:ZIP family metal transporter [Candidatus Paceibacterota bacterium]
MLPIYLAIATAIATTIGGLFALHMRDRLHLILGFAAGAVIGVAFFDLIPESFDLAGAAYTTEHIALYIAIGFLTYLIIDRTISLHSHEAEEGHTHSHGRGHFGAGSLSVHSMLDGLGIGLALKVSPAVGAVVALAVLAHDFSDGINTVSMVIKNGGTRKKALRWLAVDALTPSLGIFIAYFVTVPESALGLLLALFSGFFLYIGASDLIPESHHNHPKMLTTIMTVLGAATLYAIIHIAAF